ncbi:hypothetical protein AB9E09_35175, partial [Rhizobium leguminosarum]|uniref:hypothetical protein n=1 Tax=Rhizobium leguminosarum TaxID=384 RepID=UPI003F959D82
MTVRFYLTPIRMAKITGGSSCWRGCGEIGALLHCCWDCKLVKALWKLIWQILRKLETVLPEDAAITLLSMYPKD